MLGIVGAGGMPGALDLTPKIYAPETAGDQRFQALVLDAERAEPARGAGEVEVATAVRAAAKRDSTGHGPWLSPYA